MRTQRAAKMNFILRNKGTSEIVSGNMLSSLLIPMTLANFESLILLLYESAFFLMIRTGATVSNRMKINSVGLMAMAFRLKKNGDYGGLHVLKTESSTGKAGIILPHGILLRNAEETIRNLKKKIHQRNCEPPC